ncbi:MAG: AtpZ/AtpI family protein [bacterium]
MDNHEQQKSAMWQAFGYAWQFGYTITVPLVIFGLLGRYLDKKLNTDPWLFLTGIILSVVISTSFLMVKALHIFNSLNNKNTSPRNSDSTDQPPAKKDV